MKQSWKKLGLIYCPSGEREWLMSHASVPIAKNIYGDLFRIYFSSRDKLNQSFTCYVDIDIKNPKVIINLSVSPILSPGALGGFDDSGSMATWLTQNGNDSYLYYIGWNLGVTVPFRNSIGLAISKDGGDFIRIGDGPILDRNLDEPHFVASCCVLLDGDIWKMWYVSCTGWKKNGAKAEHRYHIKYAESLDGISWKREGIVSLDFENNLEYAISRPSVIKDNDIWRMWYSYRGESYRIGYAESKDGRNWQRLDNLVGIDTSITGWDSEMVEYPCVFDHKGDRYMLYNGNDYGRSGFGLAIQECD